MKNFKLSIVGLLSFIAIFFIISDSAILYSNETLTDYKWKRISGNWKHTEFDNKKLLFQTATRNHQWNFNLPINYCSLATLKPIDRYSSIIINAKPLNPLKGETFSFAVFLAVEYSEKSYYHNLYAYTISGSSDHFNRTSFIKSSIIDNSQMNKPGNFTVEELSSAECSIPANEFLQIEVKVNRGRSSLYVNGKEIHKSNISSKIDSGIVGFGINKSQLLVSDVSIYNKKALILFDDFKTDSIFIEKVIIQKVTK